jgi:CheY-like chemotaxis protein
MVLASHNGMLSGARVLVADDDPDLLQAVVSALESLGTNVVQASNGAELIDRLADAGPFDLIVTDIAMPWLAGVRAMHAARMAGVGTSVIVMTALRDKVIPKQVKALGANVALLRKPFELNELEAAAVRLLEGRSRQPADQTRG